MMPLKREFFESFKQATEEKWRTRSIAQEIWGFQFQPGTRWRLGLCEDDIERFQSAFSAHFPLDFRLFLQVMNGTDTPTLDIRGGSGEPHRTGLGFYSFPVDLEHLRQLVESVERDRAQIRATLLEEGFELHDGAKLIPIFAHRFVVCLGGSEISPVLSIYDPSDAIVYGNSLQEYLGKELLSRGVG
jgi:hypothetical protein